MDIVVGGKYRYRYGGEVHVIEYSGETVKFELENGKSTSWLADEFINQFGKMETGESEASE